ALPRLYRMIGPSCWATRSRSFGLLAPQFDPPAAAALYDAADGRGQKYSSPVNGCAIRLDPTTRPDPSGPWAVSRLPFAWPGNTASAPTGRYVTPFSATGISSGMTSALKITADMIAEVGDARCMKSSAFSHGSVAANRAGTMAKYLAISLLTENVVRAPRVIRS